MHYNIFTSEESIQRAWPAIERIQRVMNESFSWTAERLSLEQTDKDEEYEYDLFDESFRERYGSIPVAWGFTKVADDEWNAALVLRFLAWVSRELPEARLIIHDEGDYVLVGYLELRAGRWQIDMKGVAKQRKYLTESGPRDLLPVLDKAIVHARMGVLFASIPAIDYLDRPEIRALGLSAKDLVRLNLEQVANCIRFPWDEGATQ
ncbi:MAG: hypothetical protein JNK05_13205 [Myxococcales bacterium]|nr:hypothetical protein [Myxococcales bacterium]